MRATPDHPVAPPDPASVPDALAADDGQAPQDQQFVTFAVAGEMFAVPMAPVQEIIRVPEVARLPLAPAALDGLANLRGRVLPIMNLRRIFATHERDHDDATRALVINLGQPLGFVVDRVASVVSVEAHEIEPVRSIQSVVQADYLSGVINRRQPDGSHQLMLVLDFQRLLDDQFAGRGLDTAVGAAGLGAHPGSNGGSSTPEAAPDELRLVSFTVCGQEYAIAIAHVQEIVQVPQGPGSITAVPNTPTHVPGLISLRQRLLPLVSLRSLFGLAAQTLDEHHRIVVVALPGGGQVGLVTDAVKEVLSVPRHQADPMPASLSRSGQLQEFDAICRLDGGKRLVSIIAADRLLGLQALRDAANTVVEHAADSPPGAPTPSPDDDPEDSDTMAQHQRPVQTGTDDDAQVVIFRLGAEEFGVPIMSVQEIVRVPEVLTRVPKTPSFVEGVINLRGTVLPVIDQRTRLGMAPIARNDRQRIMVYTLGGLRTGFIVDSVAEVLRIGRNQIERAPELGSEQGGLIGQVAKLDGDKRLVMLIDPDKLLGARERMGLDSGPADADDSATLVAHASPTLARAA